MHTYGEVCMRCRKAPYEQRGKIIFDWIWKHKMLFYTNYLNLLQLDIYFLFRKWRTFGCQNSYQKLNSKPTSWFWPNDVFEVNFPTWSTRFSILHPPLNLPRCIRTNVHFHINLVFANYQLFAAISSYVRDKLITFKEKSIGKIYCNWLFDRICELYTKWRTCPYGMKRQ